VHWGLCCRIAVDLAVRTRVVVGLGGIGLLRRHLAEGTGSEVGIQGMRLAGVDHIA
jgi:hypothetical protein